MSRVIVIFSTKGGVGRSLLAFNLATYLSQEAHKKVCLIDCDLQTAGDIARMGNIKPQKAAVDLIQALKEGQDVKNESFLNRTSFGFNFLPVVLNSKQTPHLDPGKMNDIVGSLAGTHDFVIIDGGKDFNELFFNILNQANLIFLVATPDIISVSQTRWVIDTLQSFNLPLLMMKLLLNRSGSASSLTLPEIKLHIPIDIIASIPSEGKIVGIAINSATPVFISNPYSKFAAAIKKLCSQLLIDNKLYVEHRQIDTTRLKEDVFEKDKGFWQSKGLVSPLAATGRPEEKNEIAFLKQRIHNRLIEELNLKRLDQNVFTDTVKSKELKERARVMITNFLAEETGTFITSAEDRQKLVKEIVDEALGYGPLEDLIGNDGITDIMVNNKDDVYIELKGRLQLTHKKFISNDQVRVIIERIIAPIGRRIDESVPMVDARLPDGSRVNAIIPPLSLSGPTLTIRKFRKERYTVDELIKMNSLTSPMSEFIKACVICRKNMIVSGGTGSGKTTVLNILSTNIPNHERIITIEDAAELKLDQEHWIRLESRPPNIEGKGSITIRDLFRNTLRMRPDRIIIGECRGVETLDMLQAMNTGHDGSMTTVHANSTHDVLARLDSMILMSGVELPVRAIREMIASALHIIVHTSRLSDGTRKITAISEVGGMRDETHIELHDIFLFKQTGIDEHGNVLGRFESTGYIPQVLEEIKVRGVNLPESIFVDSSK